jgi:hypothetical protein
LTVFQIFCCNYFVNHYLLFIGEFLIISPSFYCSGLGSIGFSFQVLPSGEFLYIFDGKNLKESRKKRNSKFVKSEIDFGNKTE